MKTTNPAPRSAANPVKLSPGQLEIVPLVALGLRDKQIAGLLHISHSAIRRRLEAIYHKVGVSWRYDMLIRLHEIGGYEDLLNAGKNAAQTNRRHQ